MKRKILLVVGILFMVSCGTCLGIAYNPIPANGSTDINLQGINLSWTSDADSFDVLFGVSPQNLPLFDHVQLNSVSLPILSSYTTYYWRVDEHVGTTIDQGYIWSFTTGNSIPEPATLSLLALGAFLAGRKRKAK